MHRASPSVCSESEEFNTLLRAVSSVVNLSPQHLLEEIILVDDMSEFGEQTLSVCLSV